MSASGRESTSPERLQQSSHICVWKEILKLHRTLRVIRMGCWIVWTYASWSSSKLLDTEEGSDGNPRRSDGWCFSLMCVWTVCHIFRKVDALDNLASGRYDTSSGRLAGNRIFRLANVQNLLEHFWIAESLIKSIFTNKWFCPIECGQLQTNKLPLSPFWDKNHLTG